MPPPSRTLARDWASTLHLPRSSFPPRPSIVNQVPLLRRCTDDLYAWQSRTRPANDIFILHDGPPYANGNVHIGHALNKILKDIICRVQLLHGKRVDYVPGWDCHGLPIELKALQQMPEGHENQQYTDVRGKAAIAVRNAARKLASQTVAKQKRTFQQWGVMADWRAAWTTMDRSFELKQLDVFRTMVEKGLIYRQYRPVYWSPSSRTALAESELEYNDEHQSDSVFVKFPLVKVPEELSTAPGVKVKELGALIWTTTPWTLPANEVIAVRSDLEYGVVEVPGFGQLVVAQSRLAHVFERFPMLAPKSILASISGRLLANQTQYISPLQHSESKPRPVLHADFVTETAGTGLVHCAPGHGMEDYELCRQYGIAAKTAVDDRGRFTEAASSDGSNRLLGKHVLHEGSEAVIDLLKGQRSLLGLHRFTHKYPYDGRTKLPVIIRATEQWFADVKMIRERALESLAPVQFIPTSARSRLESFVASRGEWCISRQRAWGVPIPALVHNDTGHALLTVSSVAHIMSVIEEHGIDSWWTDPEDDPRWTPPELLEATGETKFRRGNDTMDVWFDSGTSWTQITGRPQQKGLPVADVYIEGTDQHRGWFQSSLLTYIAKTSTSVGDSGADLRAPYRKVVTHGFTLDSDGRKMSKSHGNVVSPDQILDGSLANAQDSKKTHGTSSSSCKKGGDGLGADALRLWVASSDFTKDIAINVPFLKAVHGSLQKIRITLKWLLGTLSDFSPASVVEHGELSNLDHTALLQLSIMNEKVRARFNDYEFYKAIATINEWLYNDVSKLYMESIKDRLYCDAAGSLSRRSVQTILYHIFNHLLGVLSPITPLLVEEAWQHASPTIREQATPPLQRLYPEVRPQWLNQGIASDLPWLLRAKNAVNAVQEQARIDTKMTRPRQSRVVLFFPRTSSSTGPSSKEEEGPSKAYQVFERYQEDLMDLFIVSDVQLRSEHHGHDRPNSSSPSSLSSASSTKSSGAEVENWIYSAPIEFGAKDGKATVYILPPDKAKCDRCWKYTAPPQPIMISQDGDGSTSESSCLCQRCRAVVGFS